jgi:hypothetical protein
MKRYFIGCSPLTSISGYIVAALLVIRDVRLAGATRWQDYILPVAIALFGRLAADDRNGNTPAPPMADGHQPINKISMKSFNPAMISWIIVIIIVLSLVTVVERSASFLKALDLILYQIN